MNKIETYQSLLQQAQAITTDEKDSIANMANLCALLKTHFNWFWIGFYRVANPNELILGPFQGPLACTRIAFGRGVCGTAWQTQQTQIVDDVLMHPNHIACSALSRSEIVIPIKNHRGEVTAVLDIDSSEPAEFDEVDKKYLEQLVNLLKEDLG